MKIDNHIPKMSIEVQSALRREANRAGGRSDAFDFALEHKGDIRTLEEEIQWYEELLANPSHATPGHPFAVGMSVRNHIDGLLPSLKDALRMIKQARAHSKNGAEDTLPETLADALHYERTIAKARSDAFTFARKCQGHVGVLLAAAQESEAFLSQATGYPRGDKSQRYGRAHYEEGYLSGLRDAIELLMRHANEGEPQPATTAA